MSRQSYVTCILAIFLCYACTKTNKKKERTTTQAVSQTAKVPDPLPITTNNSYTYEILVDGLTNPWGLAFLADNSMLITEKKGTLIHFKNGKKTSIKGLPEILDWGQGGLLDIATDPEYTTNGWIYFTYASPAGQGKGANTAIARAQLEGDSLTQLQVLYKCAPNTKKGQHFGSRIAFDQEGYLYFSAGERGNRDENPQDISRDNGKIYRLHKDGSIPKDNPFVHKANAKKAIYSYGHRNPQGMLVHPKTGAVWVHEHGPQGGDEINIITKGANYGWPIVTYGENYDGTPITDERSRPEFTDPIFYWLPSIAPCGFTYITSDIYPALKDHLLVGSLKFQYLEHLVLEGDKITKREKLLEDVGRLRNVVQGPDGYIYLGVENVGIVKLLPK